MVAEPNWVLNNLPDMVFTTLSFSSFFLSFLFLLLSDRCSLTTGLINHNFFLGPIICADLRGTAPAPLVPASLLPATPKTHSASWPRPQRSTGSDVRSLVGCHPKETLHCCRAISVVFGSGCSDWTYAGHHLLSPILTTMLAKSRSQTEWASPPPRPQRADRHYVPPSIFLCGLCDVVGFDQNCLRQGRRKEHRDWDHHENMAWRARKTRTF